MQIEAPYLFDWENAIALESAGESGLISQKVESLMGFLELRQEPGVYPLVTAAMYIRKWNLFSEVRKPV